MAPDSMALGLEVVHGEAKTAYKRGTTVGQTGDLSQDEHVEQAPISAAVGHLEAPRPHYYLGVFPQSTGATVQLTSPNGKMGPSPKQSVDSPSFVPSEVASPHVDTSGAVQWDQPQDPVSATISGSFVLVLWEDDLQLNGTTYQSGISDQPVSPALPGQSSNAASDRTERQLYLFVDQGKLTLWAPNPASLLVLLDRPSAHVSGTIDFSQAQVAQGSELPAGPVDDLRLVGDLTLQVTGPATVTIPMSVGGDIEAAQVDGQAISVATPSSRIGSHFTWWPVAAVGLVLGPGAVAGGVYRRRWSPTARMDRLEDYAELGNWAAIAREAPKLVGSRHFGFDAAVMQVDALIRLGRVDDALRLAQTLKPGPAGSGPVLEFTLAYLHAARGDRTEALQHARACLAAGPEFAAQIAAFPVFDSLRAELGLARTPAARRAETSFLAYV